MSENLKLGGDDFDSKSVYDGEINDRNERHGFGTSFLVGVGCYQGYYQRGLRHGYGEYFSENNNACYKGDWYQGLRSGQGHSCTFDDGSVYKGEWLNDALEGRGEMRYADGTIYNGMWSKGKRHGSQGKYVTGNTLYVGSWSEDKKQGCGAQVNTDGEAGESMPIFLGFWNNDQVEGKGVFVMETWIAETYTCPGTQQSEILAVWNRSSKNSLEEDLKKNNISKRIVEKWPIVKSNFSRYVKC